MAGASRATAHRRLARGRHRRFASACRECHWRFARGCHWRFASARCYHRPSHRQHQGEQQQQPFHRAVANRPSRRQLRGLLLMKTLTSKPPWRVPSDFHSRGRLHYISSRGRLHYLREELSRRRGRKALSADQYRAGVDSIARDGGMSIREPPRPDGQKPSPPLPPGLVHSKQRTQRMLSTRCSGRPRSRKSSGTPRSPGN